MVVGLIQILSGLSSIFIGREELVPNDVDLLSLLVDQGACLVDDAVNIHEVVGNSADLLVAFPHDLLLELVGESQVVLVMIAMVGSDRGIGLFRAKSVPGRPLLMFLMVADSLEGGYLGLPALTGTTGRRHFLVDVGMHEYIFPPILLYSKLLLNCAYFPGGIGVQI